MPVPSPTSAAKAVHPLGRSAFRQGIYSGVTLSAILLAWIYLANRVPFLERFAWERNLAGFAAAAAVALFPALRFLRSPWRLFVSGIIGWAILGLSYRMLCMRFSTLSDRMGAFHLFVLGGVLYTLLATLAWLGAILWHARDHHVSHSRQHLG